MDFLHFDQSFVEFWDRHHELRHYFLQTSEQLMTLPPPEEQHAHLGLYIFILWWHLLMQYKSTVKELWFQHKTQGADVLMNLDAPSWKAPEPRVLFASSFSLF